jgi:23S rRNA (uracil1939-C5)-methyltransferase
VEGGFTLDRVIAVDQFRWTAHVEIAALFTRPQKRSGRGPDPGRSRARQ